MNDDNLIKPDEFEQIKSALLSTGIVEEVDDHPRVTGFGYWSLQDTNTMTSNQNPKR